MHGHIGRAELLSERAWPHAGGDSAALPTANGQEICFRSRCNDGVFDAKDAQRLDGIRAEMKPATYVTRPGGLLVDDDFSASPIQSERGGKPADTATDDYNAWHARHSKLPLALVFSIAALRNSSSGPPARASSQPSRAPGRAVAVYISPTTSIAVGSSSVPAA